MKAVVGIKLASTEKAPVPWEMFKKTAEYVLSLFESLFFSYAVENLTVRGRVGTPEASLGDKDYFGSGEAFIIRDHGVHINVPVVPRKAEQVNRIF